MTKLQFLFALRDRLKNLPEEEVEQRLNFYSEMIEDRMEEGLSEEDAVSAVGSVEEISAQVIAEDLPAKKGNKVAGRSLKKWEIVLLAVGSPVWISLLIAAAAIGFALYISLWAVIISLWSVFGALVGCAGGCIAAGIGFLVAGNYITGAAMVGAGLVCAGISIFAFWGCKAATGGICLLTKKLFANRRGGK